jgi:hypothetical protein
MMRGSQTIMALALAALVSVAHAQVYKCIDKNGRASYVDTPCGARTHGSMIEREHANEEKPQERKDAQEAEIQKQAQRMDGQEREGTGEQQRAAQRQDTPQKAAQTPDSEDMPVFLRLVMLAVVVALFIAASKAVDPNWRWNQFNYRIDNFLKNFNKDSED